VTDWRVVPEGVEPRLAAVLLLAYPRGGTPTIVFTKRADTVAAHRGQISLPGGRFEATDADLQATALREAYEEIGVPPADVRIIGRLDDVYVVVSNFLIAPFIGTLAYAPTFRPDPREVAMVIDVPLDRLRDPAIFREEDRPLSGRSRVVQVYQVEEHEIWGATGRIVQLFLESPFVDAIADLIDIK